MPSNVAMRIFEYKITYTDGRVELVTTDQRDSCAFELQPFGVTFRRAGEILDTFMRWTSWHALRRDKATKLDWETWNNRVLHCGDAPAEPVADADRVEDGTPLAAGLPEANAGT